MPPWTESDALRSPPPGVGIRFRSHNRVCTLLLLPFDEDGGTARNSSQLFCAENFQHFPRVLAVLVIRRKKHFVGQTPMCGARPGH